MRPFAQTAFVDEDDDAAFLDGFFLTSGQRTFFQYRIASSLRSIARLAGRWQLQPNRWRIRQTCEG